MPSPNPIPNGSLPQSLVRVRRAKRKRYTMRHRHVKWITVGQRLKTFIILTTLLIAATAIGYVGSHWGTIQQTYPKRMVLNEIALMQHYHWNKMNGSRLLI